MVVGTLLLTMLKSLRKYLIFQCTFLCLEEGQVQAFDNNVCLVFPYWYAINTRVSDIDAVVLIEMRVRPGVSSSSLSTHCANKQKLQLIITFSMGNCSETCCTNEKDAERNPVKEAPMDLMFKGIVNDIENLDKPDGQPAQSKQIGEDAKRRSVNQEDGNQKRESLFKADNPTSAKNIQNIKGKSLVQFESGGVYEGKSNPNEGAWDDTHHRHGLGTQRWPDGSVYEGNWVKDKACGKGTLTHADGDVYVGEWLDDKAHGYGVYTHANGTQYKGNWKEDKQHGHGIETWPDKAMYTGTYFEGKKHGQGELKFADGSRFIGEFKHNEIDGQGCYTWKDGRRYNGEWKNSKMHGNGVMEWPDKRMYKGEFQNDKKHGQGIFTWPDNRYYQGGWVAGKQEGEGWMFNSKGDGYISCYLVKNTYGAMAKKSKKL